MNSETKSKVVLLAKQLGVTALHATVQAYVMKKVQDYLERKKK